MLGILLLIVDDNKILVSMYLVFTTFILMFIAFFTMFILKKDFNKNDIKEDPRYTINYLILSSSVIAIFFTFIKPIGYLLNIDTANNNIFIMKLSDENQTFFASNNTEYLNLYKNFTGFPKFIKENNNSQIKYVVGYDMNKFYYYSFQPDFNSSKKVYEYIREDLVKNKNIQIYETDRTHRLFDMTIYTELKVNFEHNLSQVYHDNNLSKEKKKLQNLRPYQSKYLPENNNSQERVPFFSFSFCSSRFSL
jgi:hypothetical protein